MNVREFIARAEHESLRSVEFIDANGRVGARGNKVRHIRFTFVSGRKVHLRPHELPESVEFRSALTATATAGKPMDPHGGGVCATRGQAAPLPAGQSGPP